MSGKLDKRIVIRLPSDLHRKAKVKAAMTDIPIAQAVREFLERWVRDELLTEEERKQELN